jgi:hypothetical protein
MTVLSDETPAQSGKARGRKRSARDYPPWALPTQSEHALAWFAGVSRGTPGRASTPEPAEIRSSGGQEKDTPPRCPEGHPMFLLSDLGLIELQAAGVHIGPDVVAVWACEPCQYLEAERTG